MCITGFSGYSDTVGTEPNNAIGVGTMTLHTRTALAKTKYTEAFPIVSAVDTSIDVACGLPNNGILRAST
jgi:hypothetical protein